MNELRKYAESRGLTALVAAIDCRCIDTDLTQQQWSAAIVECDAVDKEAYEMGTLGRDARWQPVLWQVAEMRQRLEA